MNNQVAAYNIKEIMELNYSPFGVWYLVAESDPTEVLAKFYSGNMIHAGAQNTTIEGPTLILEE